MDFKLNQIRDQFFEAAFRKDDHVDDVTVVVVVLIHQFQPKGLVVQLMAFQSGEKTHLGWC